MSLFCLYDALYNDSYKIQKAILLITSSDIFALILLLSSCAERVITRLTKLSEISLRFQFLRDCCMQVITVSLCVLVVEYSFSCFTKSQTRDAQWHCTAERQQQPAGSEQHCDVKFSPPCCYQKAD